ncbi:MAG: glycosyltransferase [Deltaproteobacteria bacterium]|nr:glycosyltransferase [Deltaproteobacteria bacterium]MBI3294650.1 glycosyltransferase [Deltaproteobacteria bacterium]
MLAESLPSPLRVGSRAAAQRQVDLISIVVPVYSGESHLKNLISEMIPFTKTQTTPLGRAYRIQEVIFVHDGAQDGSDIVMKEMAAEHSFVRLIWLSRNFGQHAATLAGMASTVSNWVVTMDEDGQHNPADIQNLLDVGIRSKSTLVYGKAANTPPHGWVRNIASQVAKSVFAILMGSKDTSYFSSFRMIDGEIARSLAAYCGHNVYLDGALNWVTSHAEVCPVHLRTTQGRKSTYSFGRLTSHFFRMTMTSRRSPLRLIAYLGFLSVLVTLALSAWAAWDKIHGNVPIQGWTSLFLLISFFFGVVLLSIGVIAEYIGSLLSVSMGRPLYLIVSRSSTSRKMPC